MAKSLFVSPFGPAFYQGKVATGAKLLFYETGTLLPITIEDANGDPLSNPISADLYGVFVPIYIPDEDVDYRVRMTTSSGQLIGDFDPADNLSGKINEAIAIFETTLAGIAGAGIVGFSHTATYSQGTIGLHGQGIVSVKDAPFNAVGDGVTDDTIAIAAAYTFAAGGANPRALYFPSGRYLTTQPIGGSVAVPLYGEGPTQSVIVTNTSIDAISFDVAGQHGVNISNIGIEQTLAYASISSGAGIKIHMAYYANINNVQITGTYNGIDYVQCPVSTIQNLLVQQFKNIGLNSTGNANFDLRMRSFTISGTPAGANPKGFIGIKLLDGNDEFQLTDGIISTCVNPMVCDATLFILNQQPDFCRIGSVSFDNCDDGVLVDNSTDIVFTNCFFSNRPGVGVRIGSSKSVKSIQFIGCTIINCGGDGIDVGAHAEDTLVLGCKILGNSASAGPNIAHGISISIGAVGFTCIGSKFGNDWIGVAGTQADGIYIPAGTLNGLNIVANTFTSGGGAFVNNSTGTQSVVANSGYRTYASGSATLAAGVHAQTIIPSMGNANYQLIFTSNTPGETYGYSLKNASGFFITSSNPASTATVDWVASFGMG
jgi:hypothetical protein